MILSVLKGLLVLANHIAGYLSNKQLLDAGEAKATAEHLKQALKNVKKAKKAVARAKSNPGFAKRLFDRYDIK